jgi:hypothetical protein
MIGLAYLKAMIASMRITSVAEKSTYRKKSVQTRSKVYKKEASQRTSTGKTKKISWIDHQQFMHLISHPRLFNGCGLTYQQKSLGSFLLLVRMFEASALRI